MNKAIERNRNKIAFKIYCIRGKSLKQSFFFCCKKWLNSEHWSEVMWKCFDQKRKYRWDQRKQKSFVLCLICNFDKFEIKRIICVFCIGNTYNIRVGLYENNLKTRIDSNLKNICTIKKGRVLSHAIRNKWLNHVKLKVCFNRYNIIIKIRNFVSISAKFIIEIMIHLAFRNRVL